MNPTGDDASDGAPREMRGPELRPRARWTYERGQGAGFDRVVFFTDAVFAIAMTLLIVTVEAPSLDGAPDDPGALLRPLADLWPQLFSFFLAFLLIARYWMAHHAFFAQVQRIDRRMIALNLFYLAFVAFLPFPTELVGEYEANPVSVTLFAITLAVISSMESVIFYHAYRSNLLAVRVSEEAYRYGQMQSMAPVVLFVLSIPIAFWNTTVALSSWLLTFPIGAWLARRERERQPATDTPPAA